MLGNLNDFYFQTEYTIPQTILPNNLNKISPILVKSCLLDILFHFRISDKDTSTQRILLTSCAKHFEWPFFGSETSSPWEDEGFDVHRWFSNNLVIKIKEGCKEFNWIPNQNWFIKEMRVLIDTVWIQSIWENWILRNISLQYKWGVSPKQIKFNRNLFIA